MVMYAHLYHAGRLLWPGGLDVRRKLQKLERTQWFSPDELQAWQFARIQKLVSYAYDHVPYYRDLYRHLDIHPEDVRTWQDFQALPFVTKADVNNHLEAMVSPELRSEALPSLTGGSTGEPTRFFVDRSYHRWDAALEFRGRGWYGVREGDKIALVWGAQRDMHMWNWRDRLKAEILRERYLNAFSMTEEKMKAFAEMLVRWQPAMFRAYPVALGLFAGFVKQQGIGGIRPKFIELTAEVVTGPQRELLEEVFQCPVVDWYSSREMGTIAFQCPHGGRHVCETRYLELVADGKVQEPGQMGEVVITSLHQFTMPFIRYKQGDIAVYESSPCTCRRGLPTLREVLGKTNDCLVTPDGLFIHPGCLGRPIRERPEVVRYQAHQTDERHITVRLVCSKDVDQVWLEGMRRDLQDRLGSGMHISLETVDEIPLTSAGKHRFIISEISPPFVEQA
jgi:phenylacetate-CoA ligase